MTRLSLPPTCDHTLGHKAGISRHRVKDESHHFFWVQECRVSCPSGRLDQIALHDKHLLSLLEPWKQSLKVSTFLLIPFKTYFR